MFAGSSLGVGIRTGGLAWPGRVGRRTDEETRTVTVTMGRYRNVGWVHIDRTAYVDEAKRTEANGRMRRRSLCSVRAGQGR
jgi:hypothetical protein